MFNAKESTNTLNKCQYIFLTNDIVFDKTLCNNLCFKLNNVFNQVIRWSETRFNFPRVQRCTVSKKVVVTLYLSCRVHLSCLIMLLPSSICDFPVIAGANSLVIISSLQVQVQKYTNIEPESRFLLAPNLRKLDFFWHRTRNTRSNSGNFEAAAIPTPLVHAPRILTEEVAQRRQVAVLGRQVDVAVASGGSSTSRLPPFQTLR